LARQTRGGLPGGAARNITCGEATEPADATTILSALSSSWLEFFQEIPAPCRINDQYRAVGG
jgi:hypothetical protein